MTQDENYLANASSSQSTFRPTELMLLSLRQTKPWAMLISVLGFISIGLMLLFSLATLFVFPKGAGGSSFSPNILSGIVNILMVLLYFFPALFLFKFASSIGRLLEGGGVKDLEEALLNQKSFWKFVGILTLVLFGIAIIGMVTAIVIPQIVKNG